MAMIMKQTSWGPACIPRGLFSCGYSQCRHCHGFCTFGKEVHHHTSKAASVSTLVLLNEIAVVNKPWSSLFDIAHKPWRLVCVFCLCPSYIDPYRNLLILVLLIPCCVVEMQRCLRGSVVVLWLALLRPLQENWCSWNSSNFSRIK